VKRFLVEITYGGRGCLKKIASSPKYLKGSDG
jgi:hypothetical protein